MRMRFMTLLGVGLTVALLASVAYAQRQDSPKVTGGGQIAVSSNGQGAGDTITFFGDETLQRGQVQYVPTSSGGGSSQGHWHGFVDCVFIEPMDPDGDGFGGDARLSGTTSDRQHFEVEVMDADAAQDGADPIVISKGPNDEDCKDEDKNNVTQDGDLARGEAVVHTGA